MKLIVRGILQKLLKYWTIRRRNNCPSNPATQRIILEIDWFLLVPSLDRKFVLFICPYLLVHCICILLMPTKLHWIGTIMKNMGRFIRLSWPVPLKKSDSIWLIIWHYLYLVHVEVKICYIHPFNLHIEKWFEGHPVKSTQIFIKCCHLRFF